MVASASTLAPIPRVARCRSTATAASSPNSCSSMRWQAPRTTKQYENYIARLEDVPRYFGENIANVRTGIADGFTLPAEILAGVSQGRSPARNTRSPRTRRSGSRSRDFPTACRKRTVRGSRRRARRRSQRPSSRRTRSSSASSRRSTPRGAQRRSAPRRCRTAAPTTPISCAISRRCPMRRPRAFIETGLAEVERIRAEMEAIVREVEVRRELRRRSSRSCAPIRSSMRRRADELLRDAAWICKEIDGKLPRYFGKLPRTPYGGEARAGGARAELHERPLQPGADRRGGRILGEHATRCETRRSTCCRR